MPLTPPPGPETSAAAPNSDIATLLSSILAFTGNEQDYNRILDDGVKKFGADWRLNIITALEKVSPEQRNKYKEKYQTFTDFGKARDIWNEAQRAASSGIHTGLKFTAAEFAEWLPRFGDAGAKLLSQLQSGFTAAATAAKTSGANKDMLWECDNFFRVLDYLEQSRSILGMMALKQGINFEEYKYYGFINDLYDYLLEKGRFLLSQPNLSGTLAHKIKGGGETIAKMLDEFRVERQRNFNPEAVVEKTVAGLTAASIKEKIGEISDREGLTPPDAPPS